MRRGAFDRSAPDRPLLDSGGLRPTARLRRFVAPVSTYGGDGFGLPTVAAEQRQDQANAD